MEIAAGFEPAEEKGIEKED